MQIIQGKQYFKIREFGDLREMFRQSLSLYGNSDAFVFRDTPASPVQRRTYLQFDKDIRCLGTALIAAGLRNRRIAVIGDNSYAWCVTHFSVICGVGVSVPLDRMLPEEEVLSLLERSGADAVVYGAAFQPVMEKARAALPNIRLYVCMNSFRWTSLPEVFSQGGAHPARTETPRGLSLLKSCLPTARGG